MAEVLFVAIFISAALSLLSYVYCWQDVSGGRPHILALRQITSIMDRNRLNRMFGAPQPGYYYQLDPEQVRALTLQFRGFYWRECAAEAVCMLGVWRYMTGQGAPEFKVLFLMLALACQGINFMYSLWLIHRWRDQLQEELDPPEER